MIRQLLIFVAAGLWLAFIAVGVARVETNIEDFFPWLPDDAPVRNEYMDFISRFGSDDVLMVSWEDCTLDDPRVTALAESLQRDEPRWIRGVITAPGLLQQLTESATPLNRDDVLRRLTGIVIGPDQRTTALLVQFSSEGMRNRREAVQSVIEHARDVVDIDRDRLKLGGHPYVAYYSAEQTRDSIMLLSIPVAIVSTLLAWVCLRRRRLMFTTLIAGGLAALTSFASIYWAGHRVNGLLAASLAHLRHHHLGVIHVVNYSLGLRRGQAALPHLHTGRTHVRHPAKGLEAVPAVGNVNRAGHIVFVLERVSRDPRIRNVRDRRGASDVRHQPRDLAGTARAHLSRRRLDRAPRPACRSLGPAAQANAPAQQGHHRHHHWHHGAPGGAAHST
ncbi:MAG: hypothetical protein R3B90_15695 [Planctomycetaceae bacterium]